jgi:type II secretory pathway component PulK
MNKHRRGFALIFAITLLGLVGATLALLATHFASEAKRTRVQAADAQARQLLIAGHLAARAHGDSLAAGKPVEIALPPSLVQDGAKLTIAGSLNEVRVDAEYRGRRAAEVISLTREGDMWKIKSVELSNP